MNTITNGALSYHRMPQANIRRNWRLNRISSQVSFIGGGYNNNLSGGYGVIGGGANNIVSGNYSAILGGSGNSDGGFNYTGMFGCNLTATCISKAFWVNELVAPQMPPGNTIGGIPVPPTGYPVRSLWYHIDGNGNCVVYIV